MASHLGVNPRVSHLHPYKHEYRHPFHQLPALEKVLLVQGARRRRGGGRLRAKVPDGGDSYLDMWKNAVDRERKAIDFQKIVENSAGTDNRSLEEFEKKSEEFQKILEVPKEERDRVQRMQVIDRAAAAIAAARSILEENGSKPQGGSSGDFGTSGVSGDANQEGTPGRSIFVSRAESSGNGTPGPDFWSWSPPVDGDRSSDGVNDTMIAGISSVYPIPTNPIVEKERSVGFLSIPFESKLSENSRNPPLPPLQSLIEVEKVEASESGPVTPSLKEEQELGFQFFAHAAEVALALHKVDEPASHGVNPEGSKWWKETGVEQRPDGVICRWTMSRGVSADQSVEWQEKFWEAADEFGYKELGSEKSGRDATGNVWREYWRESMCQDRGLVHLEKTADKWGKNGKGDEWQEKWWEHYSASGQAEKWAHKWCSIDPNTQLEAGHAHVWHERWGETYDGHGGSMKYTDKWAERCEGDGWTKWGDKWDENFDPNGHGVKQGETWWEGHYDERWNRTWGERHNGSGWVHKYGKSSSGEHWDTHVQQDTCSCKICALLGLLVIQNQATMKYDDSSASDSSASFESPLCYCGIPSKLRISGKATSFGRRFYNCRNYKINKQCGFFQWIDHEMELNTCCKMTLELAQRRNGIIIKERVMTEEAKLTAMEKKYKGTVKALYWSWCCFVLILAVIYLYPSNNYVM